jgi:2,3-bisphosphoglycerate-dependent phosphoglycerate mutase
MSTLILTRHGQSQWNLENRFTGWIDVDLSEQGIAEAKALGDQLKAKSLLPGVVHTSLLTRAIRTADLALASMDRSWIPVRRSWRLNERHYGALQGLDKAETAAKYGDEQVKLWRRSYDVSPPQLDESDPTHPRTDPRYAFLPPSELTSGECLADVVSRVVPYFVDSIWPDLAEFGTVLVAAHGNSLRGLVKHLEGISDADIVNLELATGEPRIYEF